MLVADRVKETSTTTGTGDVTLAGAASGFRTFNAAFGVGPLFHLHFDDADVANARDALGEDKALRKRVWNALLERDVHITGARGFVSLQHNAATVDDLVGRFDAALGDL